MTIKNIYKDLVNYKDDIIPKELVDEKYLANIVKN